MIMTAPPSCCTPMSLLRENTAPSVAKIWPALSDDLLARAGMNQRHVRVALPGQ